MSVTFSVFFESERQLWQVLEEESPDLDEYDYASTLARGYETLELAAEGAGVEIARFWYSDPEGFEDVLSYLELDQSAIDSRREKLASQTKWHPIVDGIDAFERMIDYLEEHPDVVDRGWIEPLVGAMRTVVQGMNAAIRQGDRGFHITGG